MLTRPDFNLYALVRFEDGATERVKRMSEARAAQENDAMDKGGELWRWHRVTQFTVEDFAQFPQVALD